MLLSLQLLTNTVTNKVYKYFVNSLAYFTLSLYMLSYVIFLQQEL